MSKYTVTIYSMMKNNFDFGLKDYPIFDENYRDELNNKILNHFLLEEIGFETAELFKTMLNNRMNEIMPALNELYKNQINIYKSLIGNVNLEENYNSTSTNESNSTSESNSNTDNKNVFQDTPQGNVSDTSIDNYNYATNITLGKSESSINDTSSNTGTGTNNYIKTVFGNNGNKDTIDLLNKLSYNLINIDQIVFSKLEDLFMQIY